MLNTDLVDSLYSTLTKEQQKKLVSLLFKNSKQTMNYFKRTKDTSMSKLEILADFFHLPLDSFRVGKEPASNNSSNYNYGGNISFSNKLLIENQSLRKELESVKATLEAKDETIRTTYAVIKSKDEVIKIMSSLIEALKKQVSSK